jgi:hypothetical protein
MMRFKLFGVIATLGIVLSSITGAALADPGKGNPNAPGQQKQAAAPVPAQTTVTQRTTTSQKSKAPKTKTTPAATKSKGAASQAGNASAATAGMKPANNTAKGTHCTTGGSAGSATCTSTGTNTAQAQAKSDASKRYGNGKTAAQIAVSRGGTGVDLYGPGNSQPHKATDCKHKHAVDVHAIKSYSSAACAPASEQKTEQAQTTTAACPAVTVTTLITGVWHHTGSKTNPMVLIHPSSNSAHMSKHSQDSVATQTVTQTSAGASCSSQSNTNTNTSSNTNTNTSTSSNTNAATAQQQAAAAQAAQAGKAGVLGAQASKTTAAAGKLASAGTKKPSRAGGVLGATGRAAHALGAVATRGKLPFTGFPIWAAVLIGLGLVGTGLALRRHARAIA